MTTLNQICFNTRCLLKQLGRANFAGASFAFLGLMRALRLAADAC